MLAQLASIASPTRIPAPEDAPPASGSPTMLQMMQMLQQMQQMQTQMSESLQLIPQMMQQQQQQQDTLTRMAQDLAPLKAQLLSLEERMAHTAVTAGEAAAAAKEALGQTDMAKAQLAGHSWQDTAP